MSTKQDRLKLVVTRIEQSVARDSSPIPHEVLDSMSEILDIEKIKDQAKLAIATRITMMERILPDDFEVIETSSVQNMLAEKYVSLTGEDYSMSYTLQSMLSYMINELQIDIVGLDRINRYQAIRSLTQ